MNRNRCLSRFLRNVIVFGLLSPVMVRASTYYVTPGGTSSNGTSWGDAFGSIQAALNAVSRAADPNATVYIAKTTRPAYAPSACAFTNSVALQLLGGYNTDSGLQDGMSEIASTNAAQPGLNLSTTGGGVGNVRSGLFTVANFAITNVNSSALYTYVVTAYNPVKLVANHCVLSTVSTNLPVVYNAGIGNAENDGAILNSTIYTPTGSVYAAVCVGDMGAAWTVVGSYLVSNSVIAAAADGVGAVNSRSSALWAGNNSLTIVNSTVTNLGAGYAVKAGVYGTSSFAFTNFVNNCQFDSLGSAVSFNADRFTNSPPSVVQNSTFMSRGANSFGLIFNGWMIQVLDAAPDVIVSNVTIAATNSGGVGLSFYPNNYGAMNVLFANSTINGRQSAVALLQTGNGQTRTRFTSLNNVLSAGSLDGSIQSTNPVVPFQVTDASTLTVNQTLIRNGAGGIAVNPVNYANGTYMYLANSIITKQSGFGLSVNASQANYNRAYGTTVVATNCTFSNLGGPTVLWGCTRLANSCPSYGNFSYCVFAPGANGGNASATNFVCTDSLANTITLSGHSNAFYTYGAQTSITSGTFNTSALVNNLNYPTGSAGLDSLGYNLTAGSPLINVYKLNASDPTVDFYGTTRPQGIAGLSDIGAVEYIDPGTPFIANIGVVSNVTGVSAGLVGNLTTGQAPVDVVCFWGTNDGGTVTANWASNNDLGTQPVGLITNNLAGLAPLTSYYFRYRAGNSIATNWAPGTMSFKTPPIPGSPQLVTLWATNVTGSSAGLVGNLTSGDGTVDVICYWGTNDGGTVAAKWMTTNDLGATTAPVILTDNVIGLTPLKTYYFRYCATNSIATTWATNTVQFTTLGVPIVNNSVGATNISAGGAVLQGCLVAGTPSPSVWMCWGTNDGGQVMAAWNQSTNLPGVYAAGTFFSAPITNLTGSQTYWYSCFASNINGGAWSPASTNFSTPAPTLMIGNATVVEGALGTTTNAVLAVTLSAPSAAPVSIDYAASNGVYAVAGTDYIDTKGMLTIPAGMVSTQLTVTVMGGNVFSPPKIVYMNLSSALGNTQGVVTILNTNYTVFVRGDGFGSDTNSGGSWATAYASLTNALALAPLVNAQNITRSQMSNSTPFRICVQASVPGTYYQAAARSSVTTYAAFDLDFEGGWQNVTDMPAQTGVSIVQDAATNSAGISLQAVGNHYCWRRVVVNGFAFSNVTRGIEISTTPMGMDRADILLTVSNTTVYAKNDGIYINYLHAYPASGVGGIDWGGIAQLTAGNVAITAGHGGVGHGVYISGSWQGSRITASAPSAAAGQAGVSSIASANGAGVYLTGYNNEIRTALFANAVIYNCASNGVHIDGAIQGGYAGAGSNSVQATFQNCTVVDNAGDGLNMVSSISPSWANVTNCIFAKNGGYNINLDGGGSSAFTCSEGYNVLLASNVFVNGAAQALSTNSSSADPLFYGQKGKPTPWYTLGSRASPAFHKGGNWGAYQNEPVTGGMVLLIQ